MIDDIPFTRRRLIALGGAAAATVTVTGFLKPARAAAAANWLSRASYKGRLGERFTMAGDDGGLITLTLVAVENVPGLTSRRRSLKRRDDAFTLIFEAADQVAAAQATRRFSHAELGRTDLFVVPNAPVGGPLTYSVLVNRTENVTTQWSGRAVRMGQRRARRRKRRIRLRRRR